MIEVKSIRRRHSHHGHFRLKTPSVIDHLKDKIKRKQLLHNDLSALSDGGSNQDTNINNNNSKRVIENNAESPCAVSLTSSDSHLYISSTMSPKKTLFNQNNINDNDENNVLDERDEDDSVVPNGTNEDEEKEENVPARIKPITFDRNQRLRGSKVKLCKATKSLPEATNLSDVKKRRPKGRRMGFQIRDEEFNVIFKGLPSDEKLIIAYPCYWRKDGFMNGRMFLSLNYLCFYTCFFRWEESICLAYKDIVSVTREKSAKVLQNAIKIQTKNQDQFLFASYTPKEKIYNAVFRIWKNASLGQPLEYQQLRALVYADQLSHDESSGESEVSTFLENTADDPAEKFVVSHEESVLQSQSLPVTAHRPMESSTRPVGTNRRGTPLPSDNRNVTYLSSCTCENHLARTYADRLFTFNVDKLFDSLFGENSFTRDFHSSQKLTDYVYGEWILNKETGQRERQVTYKAVVQSVLTSSSLSCRERQILEVEKPNLIYVLSSEVYNEGMKYTDAFYVATRFCMTQRDAEHSSLRVTAEIRYVKNVNGFVKTFIEKNAYSSIEDTVNEQLRRLENGQVTIANRKSHKKTRSISKYQPMNNIIPENQMEDNYDPISQFPSEITVKEKSISGKGIIYDISFLIGVVLLILHIFLCYKLYSLDRKIITPGTVCLNQCATACYKKNMPR